MDNKEIEEYLLILGVRLVKDFTSELTRLDKVASGRLVSSITFDVKKEKNHLSFFLSMLDYYEQVDKGTKPFEKRIPVEVIAQWLKNKKFVATKKGFRKQLKGYKGMTNEERRAAAYAIRKKIFEKGIPPTNFVSKVLTSQLMDEIQKKLGIILEVNLKK